jgi:hypothetical protein
VPETPADVLVVATVMPVVSVVVASPDGLPASRRFVLKSPVPGLEFPLLPWECPGSVTTDVAVCVCDTTIALAEPPVASTA